MPVRGEALPAHGTCLAPAAAAKEVRAMLWTIIAVLLILWLLGLVALPDIGSLIHLLLVLALVALVVQLLTGRRTVV
ncbi:MAG: hypothetical protein A3G84_01595 [Chloroflexi bacterium RIFCSPLOWO2_12_FULL_71_12]|nr:MAG: hypothetical protein A3G84_01595 [Chloroflexi bacterium RIFCSPLOWO2_12_FULL_71_12]